MNFSLTSVPLWDEVKWENWENKGPVSGLRLLNTSRQKAAETDTVPICPAITMQLSPLLLITIGL